MTQDTIEEIFEEILGVSFDTFECTQKENDLFVKLGKSNDIPQINFKTMKKIADRFQAEDLDIDKFSQRGCETCDFGSMYGHEILIINAKVRLEKK